MLFMDIVTWEPEDNQEVYERYEAWEYPKGYNVITEWLDISSCRVFIVYELDNQEAYARCAFPFRDIMRLETVPIMSMEKAIEILGKMEAEMAKA